VGGTHLTNPMTTGSLAEGGLKLVVNGDTVTDQPIAVTLQELYTLVIEGSNNYTGFLYRLEPTIPDVDTAGYLTAPPEKDNLQAADVCVAPVQGMTHTSSDSKNNVATILEVDVATSYLLDITVVVENTSEKSEYYYSQYKVVATGTVPAPTPAASSGELNGTTRLAAVILLGSVSLAAI
jgi:hypothetical protein